MNFVDPTGEFGIFGAFFGAFFGAGANIAWQMLVNKRSFNCIDWADVAISAIGGGFGPGAAATVKSFKAWNKAAKLAKTMRRRVISEMERNHAVVKFVVRKGVETTAKYKIDIKSEKCECE